MKRLLLVPHGLTSWNVEGRYQGQTDIPMNPQGREQAERVAESLATEKIAAIFSSDLKRAWDTASIIGRKLGLEPRVDLRLRELHFGDWEGLTRAEISARHPIDWQAWEAGSAITPPSGESIDSLTERLSACLRDVRQYSADEALILVGHRGTFRALICLALGFDPSLLHRFRLDQTSVSELLLFRDTAVLTRLNDLHHLK
jgi:broad specificity phosphatase PhoE